MTSADAPPPPPGFELFHRGSGPWLSSLGPLYLRTEGDRAILAMRIADTHANTRGLAHGGMLVTFADSALGILIAMQHAPSQPMVTVSLATDFLDAARPGDFLEAFVDIERMGRRLAFATCLLRVGERRILRASGVFSVVSVRRPREDFEG